MIETLEPPTLSDPPADPLPLFDAWYSEAVACDQIKYAHAACLSTIDLDGLPDGRTVLLKIHDAAGFVFFTDTGSVKGRSLSRVPAAALTFYWGPLDRQIRIRGGVDQASDEVSDACFNHRPRGSRITAWACRQSQQLDAGDLERRIEALTERFANHNDVPRPPHWQAYRLVPRAIEFWQAKANRLHDRLLYTRAGAGWTTGRLEP